MQSKFTNMRAAQDYLKENKYNMQDIFSIKSDRTYIYKHKSKRKYIKLAGEVRYLNNDTMDRGLVWILEAF
tara:strand:- start:703 stop:915 length:213 start_codon:yes stop_codon:yes gene_type:complete